MSPSLYSPVFYEATVGEEDHALQLSPEESRHALQVLRVRLNDPCVVVNGQGLGRQAFVAGIEGKQVKISLGDAIREFGEPKFQVTLGLGISTNDRFDAAIAAGIEAGVCRFVPLVCDKCKFSPDEEKAAKRKERWERIAIAAMKQSRRSRLAHFDEPITLDDWISKSSAPIIAFSPEGTSRLESISATTQHSPNLRILVGPVAGFSEREIALLQKASGQGVEIVSLGERILRFETAVPVAVSLVLAAIGEYSQREKCR